MAVKPCEIGKMRETARFEVNNPTRLGAGMKDDYDELTTTRGWLHQQSGNRALSFGEAVLDSQWLLECRFYAELTNEISKSVKVLCRNMIFTIAKYEVIDEKDRRYVFTLNYER